jgi:hypothetical protein
MPTKPARWICAATLALALCAPRLARADEPTPAVMEKSSALYKQARALQTRGKWAEAELAYQAAWDLRKTFDIAGNLGDCEIHVGQLREAAEHLSYAIENVPAGVAPEQIEALKKLRQDAQRQIGTLRVSVNVGGARLYVDGRPIEIAAGGGVYVEPGTRTIEARVAGYEPARRTIEIRAGKTETIDLVLSAPRRSIVPAIVMGSAGGVALVTGIGLLATASAKASTVRDLYDGIVKAGHSCVSGAPSYDARCDQLHGTASSGDALHNAAIGVLTLGGAAAVGAVVYSFWPQPVRVVPAASATSLGLVWSGTF